jgi:hypothetical protein
MSRTSKWHTTNKWGENLYVIPFDTYNDALHFAKCICRNFTRFSFLGLHRKNAQGKWEISYRPRKEYPWKEDVA